MNRWVGSIILDVLILTAGCGQLCGTASETDRLLLTNEHNQSHTVQLIFAGPTTVTFETTLRPGTDTTIENLMYNEGEYQLSILVDGNQEREFTLQSRYRTVRVQIRADGIVATGSGSTD